MNIQIFSEKFYRTGNFRKGGARESLSHAVIELFEYRYSGTACGKADRKMSIRVPITPD